MSKFVLRYGVLGYLALLLVLPVGMVGYRTFEHGAGPVWDALSSHDAVSALKLSLLVTLIAVPINIVFGVFTGWLLARREMPLRWLVDALINLPFAMSPVVVGLAVFVLYSRTGWIGTYLFAHGIPVLFTWKAMTIATVFVSLPFVVREVVPVLEEIGTEQEQAAAVLGASQLQAFFRVTLPAIRWAVLYGVVLTLARCLGEYGAVAVVSGRLVGKTQTATLFVEERFQNFDQPAAYAMAFVLAALAIIVLISINIFRPDRER